MTFPMDARLLQQLLQAHIAASDTGVGRPLEQLIYSQDNLNGQEGQRLRTWFTQNGVKPSRDLDDYGTSIMCGDLDKVKEHFAFRVAQLSQMVATREEAREAAARSLYALRWGPTRIPIYNLILVGTILAPWYRGQLMALTRWLIQDAKVPVDGKDVTGATAIHHALACSPTLELEFAQMLVDAGADVNEQDRFGCTAMHEAMQVHNPTQEQIATRAHALVWVLAHGGNVDVREGDGRTVRDVIDSSVKIWQSGVTKILTDIVRDDDERRARLGPHCCGFCGRVPEGDVALFVCSRCKTARYCPPPRRCQAGDWPSHKITCRKQGAPASGS